MIGIVVVSHSHALAQAAVALASEMVEASDLPRIATAAGLDEVTFGTDAAAVAEAVGEADSPDGVLVLVDLGSAVMSAEMALEFVDPELADRVVISSAPLVEGLVAAVVLASTGADLAAVLAEAQAGLAAKQAHLGNLGAAPPLPANEDALRGEESTASAEITITMPHGLHARPAAKLVSLVRGFSADVTLAHQSDGALSTARNAASLSQVATLNARQGDRLVVRASGPDAKKAVTAVAELAGRHFGEAELPDSAPPRGLGDNVGATPIAGSPTGSGLDIALGAAVVPELQVDTTNYEPGDTALEASRSGAAVDAVQNALRALRDVTASQVGTAEAEIFDAHLALVGDPDLLDNVETDIAAGCSAIEAWQQRLAAVAASFEGLDDPYQRERAQDVREVERRLLRELVAPGKGATTFSSLLSEEGILVIPELDATTAALLDGQLVRGVITRQGGATGHGVIVAKSRGIPLFTDAGDRLDSVCTGTLVGFDIRTDQIWVEPGEQEVRRIRAEVETRIHSRQQALASARDPAVTQDGRRILVMANVNSVEDAAAAVEIGAEGSGLVRTEVLFGSLCAAPSVEDQTRRFLSIAAAMDGRPITIRTWDVGGDKPLPFLPQPREANPFLGERGVRLFRRRPEVLRDQLQAVCRAAHEARIQVMFPMVSTPAEVAWALDQLTEAASRDDAGMPAGLRVGIMVEVPSAALTAGRMSADLDFVSIGTNDLTQYTMAAERGNAAVGHLVQALDPAVLQLVKRVCDDVSPDVEVAVCGDLAGSASGAVLLTGLGVRELSVVGPAVPEVKAALRRVSLSAAQALGQQALRAYSVDDVTRLCEDLLS